MKNPFIKISEKDGGKMYLDATCSINKVVIKKLPVYGIDDKAEGKNAAELFGANVLNDEIRKNSKSLGINAEKAACGELPLLLEDRLKSDNEQQRSCAENIAKKLGGHLGLILLTLKQGSPENRSARSDWTDEHWDYWASIENIIIVGGLSSGYLGQKLIEYAKQVFIAANEKPYNIIVFEKATHVGVMGCAKLIDNPSGINVVMDFGQTNIKRSIIKREKGEIVDIINLPSTASKYMGCDIDDPDEKKRQAVELHKYLINAILETYMYAMKIGEVGSDIIVSIASYTIGGRLNDERGGYAKLSLLFNDYADCISEELSGRLKRQVRVKLIHDGTAVAIHFSDYKNSVCLTLGTFIGVGFPDIKAD